MIYVKSLCAGVAAATAFTTIYGFLYVKLLMPHLPADFDHWPIVLGGAVIFGAISYLEFKRISKLGQPHD
jgi:hypothetical protein